MTSWTGNHSKIDEQIYVVHNMMKYLICTPTLQHIQEQEITTL